jgi:hypothetical protein
MQKHLSDLLCQNYIFCINYKEFFESEL